MNEQPIKVLLIEDNPTDALLIRENLAEATSPRFELTHVERLGEALQRLDEKEFDVILLDLGLPDGQGLDTFIRARDQAQGAPIIMLTGLDDEALALKTVQEGAQDYLVKREVDSNSLARSIRYAIERRRLMAELQEALAKVKTLSGMLPICTSCKKIRDDKGYWQQIELYIRDHSEAEFTHSCCPDCARKLYPDL